MESRQPQGNTCRYRQSSIFTRPDMRVAEDLELQLESHLIYTSGVRLISATERSRKTMVVLLAPSLRFCRSQMSALC